MSRAGTPRIDHYDWVGGREAMLRFGPAHGPTAVVALPLLEEANRTRAFACGILRALAVRGIAGVLPEMPGTSESLVATTALHLADLRAAFAAAIAACAGPVFAVGIRSGALYSSVTPDPSAKLRKGLIRAPAASPTLEESGDPAQGGGDGWRWQLSPQTGAELIREWRRLRDAGDGVTVAGNRVAEMLWNELTNAEAPPARVVRLAGDPRPADLTVEGSPPWRRAEPDGDPALAERLADELAQWIAACVT